MEIKKLNQHTARKTERPERIIQFGEGNFLRAFADWIVWKMNEKTAFNGSVVVVQPIPTGMVDTLNEQDGLYHLILKGLENNKPVYHTQLIDVISRGINPYADFKSYLALAEQPEIRFIISNTTEAGIAFVPEDQLTDTPASSYPGKLTQLLYHRFNHFGGAMDKGLILFPCELIFENGHILKECIHKYSAHWKLGEEFDRWFQKACKVCSTLVDRIVPGYPREDADGLTQKLGYEDKLLDEGEVFHLWVIEAPKETEKEFPASQAGLNVLFVPSEKPYHERKVTLLNGPHTVLSPVGYLAGFDTVRECVEDETIGRFLRKVMFEELLPTLKLPEEELTDFADSVISRFRNPYVKHYLTSIMLNSFSKYKTRDLPGLKTYLQEKGKLPDGLVLGLAAIFTYYKGGKQGDREIILQDEEQVLTLMQALWQTDGLKKVAEGALAAQSIWGEDLNKLPGLTERVTFFLQSIQEKGMTHTVKEVLG